MDKTKIDWCDSTWNPVTGCLRGCEYCYAKKIAERFGTEDKFHTFIGGRPVENVINWMSLQSYPKRAKEPHILLVLS